MTTQAPSKIQQLRIIWMAITSSVIIYGLIAWMTITKADGASTEQLYGFVSNPLSFALAIAALGAFFASVIIPGMMIRSRRRDQGRGPVTSPPSAFEIQPEILPAMIVRYALLEAPAIMGLVGAFVLREWRFFLPFGALSLLGLVLTFPTATLLRSLDETHR